MGKVLETPPREQSGGDSYNRYEYQVHSIVYQIINLLNKSGDEIVFCEFHEDFALIDSRDQELYDFYQVKTKDDGKEWSLSNMTERKKDALQQYKSTFLGRMFSNYLMFGNECRHCYFLSNENFCDDVKEWVSYAQDGKQLKTINNDLFIKIRDRLLPEFKHDMPTNFDSVFEDFINKSIIIKSDLALLEYESRVKMSFFESFESQSIPIDALTIMYESILRDVRRKSKISVTSPISKESLIDKKGISIGDVRNKVSKNLVTKTENEYFITYLHKLNVGENHIQLLVDTKRNLDVRLINPDNYVFTRAITIVQECIHERIQDCTSIFPFDQIVLECRIALQQSNLDFVLVKDEEIEVEIYERMFRIGISLL